MVYITPQVRVFQQYTTTPTVDDVTRRACVIGPNSQTHRFSVASEKAGLDIGTYDSVAGLTADYPNRTSGSLVDLTTVKVWCENALLRYFVDVTGSGDTFTPNTTFKNRVRATATNFVSKTGYAASATVGDREAKAGDVVHITGTVSSVNYDLWSVIDSFVQDVVPSAVILSSPATTNQASVVAASSISQTAGGANCVVGAVNAASYTGFASGDITETYTVTVVTGGVPAAAQLRVTSASGRDTVTSLVTPAAMAAPTTIGTRGLTVTFTNTTAAPCIASAALAGISSTEFVAGQVFTVSVTQAFDSSKAVISNPTGYVGAVDDTYIVTVTKGGLFAALPEIEVRTAKGLDRSLAPVVVTAVSTPVNLGTYGLQVQFSKLVGAGAEIVGLRKGDSFSIAVSAPAGGPARTLVLRDHLPAGLLPATDLNVSLYIARTIEVTENRLDSPPSKNWVATADAVTVNPSATTYLTDWTVSGVIQPLSISTGLTGPYGTEYGKIYVEYSEFLVGLASELNFAFSTADLDSIPGPLEPGNPLKFGVLKALENANGAGVGYISVADPSQLTSWQDAVDVLDGRTEIYTFVPLSHDAAVHSLMLAQAVSESSAEATNWKRIVVNTPYLTSTQLIAVDDSNITIVATIANNTLAGPTGNTLVTVQLGSSQFLQKGVRNGDTMRISYTLDGFGAPIYTTYVVDRVVSDVQLILVTGPAAPIVIAEKIEVWRTLNKTEVAQNIAAKAGALGSTRAMLIAPDVVTANGYQVEGYYLCAGIAGRMSSVLPHQGLTHFPISGFSGIKARTKDFFTKTQMDLMAEAGVWIVVQDESGAVYSRHAVTTDVSTLIKREEVMGRNLDTMSYEYRNMFKNFIGVTNATPTVLTRMDYLVSKKLETDSSAIVSNDLGPRIISGAIAVDLAGNKLLRIHPLAADRVELVLNIALPGPNNVTDLYLIV